MATATDFSTYLDSLPPAQAACEAALETIISIRALSADHPLLPIRSLSGPISYAELRRALSISSDLMRAWIDRGMPYKQDGNRKEFDPYEVADWLFRNRDDCIQELVQESEDKGKESKLLSPLAIDSARSLRSAIIWLETATHDLGRQLRKRNGSVLITGLHNGVVRHAEYTAPNYVSIVWSIVCEIHSNIKTEADLATGDFESESIHVEAAIRKWPKIAGKLQTLRVETLDQLRAQVERERDGVLAKLAKSDGLKWSKPNTPSQWAKAFDCSVGAFQRYVDDGSIRAKKLSDRSYRVAIDDLPASDAAD